MPQTEFFYPIQRCNMRCVYWGSLSLSPSLSPIVVVVVFMVPFCLWFSASWWLSPFVPLCLHLLSLFVYLHLSLFLWLWSFSLSHCLLLKCLQYKVKFLEHRLEQTSWAWNHLLSLGIHLLICQTCLEEYLACNKHVTHYYYCPHLCS